MKKRSKDRPAKREYTLRQKEITRGGHSYIESGLPDYLTDREIQILREYVVGSQVSDPERVIEELKRRAPFRVPIKPRKDGAGEEDSL